MHACMYICINKNTLGVKKVRGQSEAALQTETLISVEAKKLLIKNLFNYRIAGKFGEFDESSVIRQTKTIQIFTYNYYLMAESIHSPNFSSPNAYNSEIRQTFSPPNFPAIRYLNDIQYVVYSIFSQL